MEQLDNNKIPKLSSVGRKYHDTQVIAQLPRQDLSADCCRHLKTDSQRESFDEFCRSRNTDALGIGHVIANVPSTAVRVMSSGLLELMIIRDVRNLFSHQFSVYGRTMQMIIRNL